MVIFSDKKFRSKEVSKVKEVPVYKLGHLTCHICLKEFTTNGSLLIHWKGKYRCKYREADYIDETARHDLMLQQRDQFHEHLCVCAVIRRDKAQQTGS